VIQIDETRTHKTRKEAFEYLRNNNIGVNVHYIPVHLQPYYRNLGFNEGDFPNAENYYQRAITLPLYYDLQQDQQDFVAKKLKEALCD
jgi:dTDP-4-amino-4,6-dideoxygalactose transaminase